MRDWRGNNITFLSGHVDLWDDSRSDKHLRAETQHTPSLLHFLCEKPQTPFVFTHHPSLQQVCESPRRVCTECNTFTQKAGLLSENKTYSLSTQTISLLLAKARQFVSQFQQLIGSVHNAVMLQLWLRGLGPTGHYIALVTCVTDWQPFMVCRWCTWLSGDALKINVVSCNHNMLVLLKSQRKFGCFNCRRLVIPPRLRNHDFDISTDLNTRGNYGCRSGNYYATGERHRRPQETASVRLFEVIKDNSSALMWCENTAVLLLVPLSKVVYTDLFLNFI